MKTLICMPTYNERQNLEAIINRIFSVTKDVHVLIIDDNSPDGTGRIADKIAEQNLNVKVLHRKEKLGLASAYVQGFKFGMHCNYDALMSMDADFSHDPRYLTEFLEKAKDHDFVIGSRYVEHGGTVNWGLVRKITSRGGSLYARLFLGCPYKDLTGGFNLYKADLLKAINLDTLRSQGYAFQIEIKNRAYRMGFKGTEIPIIFEDRRVGQSKMSGKIFLEAVLKVPLLRFQVPKRKAT